MNPATGIHPLADIAATSARSIFPCCDKKSIPARHVVSIRYDNSFHVWSEFYLENIGWVPVDVTYKNSDPKGDYFGKLTRVSNGIVVNRDMNIEVSIGEKGKYIMPIFQTFGYWYWYSSGSGTIVPEFRITGKKL